MSNINPASSCKRGRQTSAIWNFFREDLDTPELAECLRCPKKIRRAAAGSDRNKWSTKAMWTHLKSAHAQEYEAAETTRKNQETEKEVKKQRIAESQKIYQITNIFPRDGSTRSEGWFLKI